MIGRHSLLGALALMISFCSAAHAGTPTLIESEPGGKRVLEVDEKTVTLTSTGKIVLYIDGNDILTNVHDPAVLVVDDSDVRHTPAGVKLATFDGDNIRHGNAVDGKVIMNYHHPDICPDSRANRVYTVNGPELSKQQLVAVLYALKPELFKLSAEEEAAQKKAMAEAGAEADRLAAADQVAGKWQVLNGTGPIAKIGSGQITFDAKKGEAYPVTLDYTKAGGPSFTGVAVYKNENGDKLVWAAYGTPKTIGLCVYEIDGGKLTGKWYPWYGDGDAKNVGTENLSGPNSLSGEFKIDSAKAPATGAAYTGTVTIAPLKIVGAGESEQPYSLTWKIGGATINGIGIRTGKYLFVASGTGADVNIAKFKIDNGSFSGDYFKLGSKEMGSTAATSMN